jgi:flagellar basal body-associated protein FliL
VEDIAKTGNKKQLTILIISGAVIFIIGVVAGIFLGGIVGPQKAKVAAANNLSSKVVSSMVVYGKVKSISGRNITLDNLGDTSTISIAASAPVYSFRTSEGVMAKVQQIVKFGDIRIGDNVNISVKLLPSGQLQGSSVIVLPTAK